MLFGIAFQGNISLFRAQNADKNLSWSQFCSRLSMYINFTLCGFKSVTFKTRNRNSLQELRHQVQNVARLPRSLSARLSGKQMFSDSKSTNFISMELITDKWYKTEKKKIDFTLELQTLTKYKKAGMLPRAPSYIWITLQGEETLSCFRCHQIRIHKISLGRTESSLIEVFP